MNDANKASEMRQMKPFPFPMALIICGSAELKVSPRELASPQMLSKCTCPGAPGQGH